MMAAAIAWVIPAGLVVYCGWAAYSAWTPSLPEKSRSAYLAALLEAGFVVVVCRLMIEFSSVTVWLWVLSVAALGIAAAGLVIRWTELPGRRVQPESGTPANVRVSKTRGPGPATVTGYAAVLAAAVAASVVIG